MKFYHCFFTDLPDQFVEANADGLIKWADGWKDKNRYYRRSMMVDTVAIDFLGNAKKEDWPRLKAPSEVMIANWMARKGANYNGGYWGTLAEDQRDPHRISGGTGGNYTIDPATVTGIYASSLAAARRHFSSVVWLGEDRARPKPPLRRDGVVAGEIVGYRCWRVENGLLRSVYQTDVWNPGHVLEGRELGDWDSRGIHAWKDSGSKEYHDYIRSYLNRDGGISWTVVGGMIQLDDHERIGKPAMATGTAFLWGDVVEHQRGWRAEYARVRSLDWLYPDATMMGREEESLNQLRARYGVLT